MDKNIFNNLLSKADNLQTRLGAYNSFKNEYYGKNNSSIPSEITFSGSKWGNVGIFYFRF